MTIDDRIIRDYLQAAHDRGGSFEMAMRMMADRLLVLEDRLLRHGVAFPPDDVAQFLSETKDKEPSR